MTQPLSNPVTDAFFALHHNLPRQGPGSDETTRHLLRLAGPGRSRPRVLDVGCGPGRAALLLAAEADAHVVAVDLHQPFLDELADTAAQQDLSERISTVNCSMDQLPFPDHSFDMIWAEGSVYNIGFDTALRAWRRLLTPDGVLVVTEIEWSTDTPAPPPRAFWADSYPLRTTEENTTAARSAGYRVSAHHPLPESDWWDEYYTPLSERLDAADPTRPGMAEAISAQREEITLRREHGGDYRYAGYVLHPAHPANTTRTY
ncbi:class I SAM-dependent methyltransferase [Nocardia sp. NPDC051990]|uniref:class I SAM-dependent methyltransferase n=1 Tax=Nocardia sp. NPDC051990 TaxID=3155285 RepID=UPI003422B095